MDPFSEQLLDVLSGRDDVSWMTASSGRESTRKISDLSEESFERFVGALKGTGVDVEMVPVVASGRGEGWKQTWRPVQAEKGDGPLLLSGLDSLPSFEMELITPRPDSRCTSPMDAGEKELGIRVDFGWEANQMKSEPKPVEGSLSFRMAELSPIPEPKQYKRWKNATPSKFCHFCGRLPKGERVACKNITQGTCRKVFCKPCMEKIFGEWDATKADSPTWECTHCSGACPKKASCRYYSKTNNKRFQKK